MLRVIELVSLPAAVPVAVMVIVTFEVEAAGVGPFCTEIVEPTQLTAMRLVSLEEQV